MDSLDEGLLEQKSTRIGPTKSDEDQPKMSERWLRQVKSYMVDNQLTSCEFAIIHIMQAELIVWRLEFEEEELEEHWNWMLHRKRIWKDAKEANEAPASFKYNEDWECKGCQYLLLCQLRASLVQTSTPRLRIV